MKRPMKLLGIAWAAVGGSLLVPGGSFPPAFAQPGPARPLAPVQQAADHEQAAGGYCLAIPARVGSTAAQCNWAKRVAAARHVKEAERVLAAGGSPAAALALLNTDLGMLWQGLVMRGDLRQKLPGPDRQVDFAAASQDYQTALNIIDATEPAVDPVPEADIASIWRKAEQTRMLADQPVAYPMTRSGTPGGLASRGVRSFHPVSVAMPVQFVFDGDAFTPAGVRAAEDLARLLDTEGRPPVRLVGHTDPEGTDDYNIRLSKRRAAAVARFLIVRGYDPRLITADGRGKREPLAIEGRNGYTPEQIGQILRRVELQRP